MAQKLVVVLGGNGYLGQRIVNCALKRGASVISISRSGMPPPYYSFPPNLPSDVQVTWHKGNFLFLFLPPIALLQQRLLGTEQKNVRII